MNNFSWNWTTATSNARQFDDALLNLQMSLGLTNDQADLVRQEAIRNSQQTTHRAVDVLRSFSINKILSIIGEL